MQRGAVRAAAADRHPRQDGQRVHLDESSSSATRLSMSSAAIDPRVNPATAARPRTMRAGAPSPIPAAAPAATASSVGSPRSRTALSSAAGTCSPDVAGDGPHRLDDRVDLALDLVDADAEDALRVGIRRAGPRPPPSAPTEADAEDVALAQWLDVDALSPLLMRCRADAPRAGPRAARPRARRGLDGASGVGRIAHKRGAEERAVVLRQRRHEQLRGAVKVGVRVARSADGDDDRGEGRTATTTPPAGPDRPDVRAKRRCVSSAPGRRDGHQGRRARGRRSGNDGEDRSSTTMTPDGRLGVVTLVDRLVHGGAERLAAEIATRLDPERSQARCACAVVRSGHTPAAPEVPNGSRAADAAGVRFLGLSRRGRWDIAAWGPLVRLLRSGDVEVVHGHMFGSNVWAVVLGPPDRRPGRGRARAQLGLHRRSLATVRGPARDRPRKRCRHRVLARRTGGG